MVEAVSQDVRTFTGAGEAAVQAAADLISRKEVSILDAAFHISVAILFWIEVSCIGR